VLNIFGVLCCLARSLFNVTGEYTEDEPDFWVISSTPICPPTKFEGYRHATYQLDIFHTGDSSSLAWTLTGYAYLSVKPRLLMKNVDFSNRQRLKVG